MRIITTNAVDEATLSSSSFVTTMPVTNLQLEGRTRLARSTSAAGPVVINGSWTLAQTISAACLYRHNLGGGATWRVELFNAPAQGGDTIYDSGAVEAAEVLGWGEFAWGAVPWGAYAMGSWDAPYSVMWFEPVTALSFRVTLGDPGNAAGYLQAKRLLLGAHFEPEVGPEYGMALSLQDSSEQVRTAGGSLRTEDEATWRRLEASLAALSESERASMLDMLRAVGLKREVFLSVFPGSGGAQERDHALLGKFVQMPSQVATYYSRYAQDIVFEEI